MGPPVKEACEWKRVWKDWKSCIRKKITNNRLEDSNASGKGSLYQDTLTPLEDAVAVISDLYDMADTIVEARPKARSEISHSLSLRNIKTDHDDTPATDNGKSAKSTKKAYYIVPYSEDYEEEEEEEECGNPINVRSVKLEQSINSTTPRTTPKKRKLDDEDSLQTEQESSVPVLMDIAKELRDLNRQTRLNAQRTEANTEAILTLGTRISDIMQQQLRERKRLNVIMEKFVLKMEATE